MRTFRLLGMAIIAILASINFASCSSDDENSPNADGVIIKLPCSNTQTTSEEFHEFWIDEKAQRITYKNNYNGESVYLITDFLPFTEKTFLNLISNRLGKTITTENLNEELCNFETPQEYQRLWSLINDYQYVAFYNGELENRYNSMSVFVYNKRK